MNMDLICLLIVFLAIIAVIKFRKPLYIAMITGIVMTVVLFRIPLPEALQVLGRQAVAKDTLTTLLAFYVVIFVQRMLEKRDRLSAAEQSFNALIRNRRLNTIIPTAIMGLLPSAAVMPVCADMVDKTTAEYLDPKQKTMVACYYRHIPEMFLPTYPSVLMCFVLSSVNPGQFVILMVPMAVAACVICYFFYLRRIPREMPPIGYEVEKGKEILNLLKNLWTLIAILFLLVAFNIPIYIAGPIVILVNLFVDRFKPEELPPLLKKAADPVLLGNMFLIMLFKGILSHTGVITQLPVLFGSFPIPLALSFTLLFFVATIVAGAEAIIALCMPMAYAAIPDGGVGLSIMLMCAVWAAMEISPTHVCSFLSAEFFKTTLGDLIVRAIPVVLIFTAVAYAYGELIRMVF